MFMFVFISVARSHHIIRSRKLASEGATHLHECEDAHKRNAISQKLPSMAFSVKRERARELTPRYGGDWTGGYNASRGLLLGGLIGARC